MTQAKSYLLQISIGPVQDFISAARRTRDLWFGSHMLSEISKAVARTLKDAGADLIFPHPGGDLSRDSDLNVANVILAQISGTWDDLDRLASEAQKAAEDRFKDFAEETFERVRNFIEEKRWREQLEDVIEFYAAWVELAGEDDYKRARQEAARLLAARKNLRDFKPHKGEAGIPKSSLDGLRESVFKSSRKGSRPRGVKEGESLDAVGLIKRRTGDEGFPSVSSIAVNPWVRGASPKTLEYLKPHCEALVKASALSRVTGIRAFPYDGTAVLVSRHASLVEEAEGADEVRKACKSIAEILSNLPASKRPQEPYFALLVADGDRMGRAIASLNGLEPLQAFSSALSNFAAKAREVVEANEGVCVYAGGDDVLAFVPLDTCLQCARGLREVFGECLRDYKGTSLSVGVSIGHAMEDLEDLLAFARKAESIAKKGLDGKAEERGEDRDGLAVVVRSRGGSPVMAREQWKDEGTGAFLSDLSLDERLAYWAQLFLTDALPNKFPYELRENVLFYKNWQEGDTLRNALREDMVRVFNRKDVNLSKEARARVEDYIHSVLNRASDIENLSAELLVAQWVAFGVRQSSEERRVWA
ncbi:MAG: type III-B CRISPR-associated protein Cas10/Cmr2 [Fretibacterium sp.]|nr:type III-B CRISPR-associated protein Cas10/Cmr2 [Fretibacterium sp.]